MTPTPPHPPPEDVERVIRLLQDANRECMTSLPLGGHSGTAVANQSWSAMASAVLLDFSTRLAREREALAGVQLDRVEAQIMSAQGNLLAARTRERDELKALLYMTAPCWCHKKGDIKSEARESRLDRTGSYIIDAEPEERWRDDFTCARCAGIARILPATPDSAGGA